MNFVLRTLLRRILESHVGENEEIEYERKYKEMKGYRILFICIVSELNLVCSHPSTFLDSTFESFNQLI
jgi:hypothetical protein